MILNLPFVEIRIHSETDWHCKVKTLPPPHPPKTPSLFSPSLLESFSQVVWSGAQTLFCVAGSGHLLSGSTSKPRAHHASGSGSTSWILVWSCEPYGTVVHTQVMNKHVANYQGQCEELFRIRSFKRHKPGSIGKAFEHCKGKKVRPNSLCTSAALSNRSLTGSVPCGW